MKKLLPLFIFLLMGILMSAQCDKLFFSEYVEGYANNKALEIYNPTSSAINLSDYSIARFRNGSTTVNDMTLTQLPDMMIEADDVFVVVIDIRDTADWDTNFDKPAWNGYNVIDTIFDQVTGEPVIVDGEVLLGPQYVDNGNGNNAIFGDEYNEMYDLQCKADAFLNPIFEENNTMYFNGNDAMMLLQGTAVEPDGSNILDVIGVIGQDPDSDPNIMQPAWVNADGFWVTRDRSIVRKISIETGRNALEDVVLVTGGSFMGEEWDSYRKNSFEFLGTHKSVCNVDHHTNEYSCSLGPVNATQDINVINFSMFPNPNKSSHLTIKADDKIISVQVANIIGQQLLRVENTLESDEFSFGLGALEKGIYMVQIAFPNNQMSIQKLIIE